MRLLAGVLALGAALGLSGVGWTQPPYEVRSYIDDPLENSYPGAPATVSENTVKEPWVCPYCGYSTGGTMDVLDLNGNGSPDGDDNANGVPDQAEGNCPNPWNIAGHPANVPLAPLSRAQRLFAFRWLGPLLDLVRGIPYRVGDQNVQATADERSTVGSRVRAALAFSAPGTPGFASGSTQVRFLLIPPGVARPTARYHSLSWRPTDSSNAQIGAGTDYWGEEPATVADGALRVGVHPWRAVDGDIYQIRCRKEIDANPAYVQVWSDANGLEYNANVANSNAQIFCSSGAIRLTIPVEDLAYDITVGGTQWWAFSFTICNNSRTIPHLDYDGVWKDPAETNQIDWLSDPTTPTWSTTTDDLRDNWNSPQNYFTTHPLAAPLSGTGVADTDFIGDDTTAGPTLDPDGSGRPFRLHPGETGTGMVAAIWRNSAANMWSYDGDSPPDADAASFDPSASQTAHENGIQPVAARFFCTRIDTRFDLADQNLYNLDQPTIMATAPGSPGGQTDVAPLAVLGMRNRQVGEVARCPVFVPNLNGRGRDTNVPPDGVADEFHDPYWKGPNGTFVGRGAGGDPPGNYNGDNALPDRTIGCGAVHLISAAVDCWCARRHDPSNPDSMYCNYCGTQLLARGSVASNEVADVERGEARVDIAGALEATSHQAVPDPARTDASYALPTEAVRGSADGVLLPGGTVASGANPAALYPVINPLFVDIPQFQLPSFAPGAGGAFENGPDQPYRGAFLAYRTADEDRRWYEDLTNGAHDGWPVPTAAFPAEALFDANGAWEHYYVCPDCGNKSRAMAFAPDVSGTGYLYTDAYTTVDELDCSYGRVAGAPAPNNTSAECPGHQVCTCCGTAWESQGEGLGTELQEMTLTVCPWCGTDLNNPASPQVYAQSQQNRLTYDDLTAEEFDPLVVEASVMRKTRLGAGQKTVDLGRTAPGRNDPGGFPVEVSSIGTGAAESQGNFTLQPPAVAIQGASAANPSPPDHWTFTSPGAERLSLVRDDVDPAAENRSAHRVARSMPLTAGRLFASVPLDDPSAANWGVEFVPRYRGSAGGQAVRALIEAGTWAGPGPADDAPVPNAVGTGSYSGPVIAYVDTNGDGALGFLDRSNLLAPTNSLARTYDPTEDVPLEPVVDLNVRLRVVESPLPVNAPEASDSSPAALLLDTDDDGLHDGLEVLWESNRLPPPGGAAPPDAAVNIFEGRASAAGGPGIARDYQWDPVAGATAVTTDTAARTVNGSPEVYVDRYSSPGNVLKWALWHKLTPTPTEMGAASTLWSSFAPGNLATPFGAAANTNYIFDSSLDKSSIRGFINPGATAPNNHWSFWNSGKRGHEEIHFCAGPEVPDPTNPGGPNILLGYSPRDPNTVDDRILPVSNGIPPKVNPDYVMVGGIFPPVRKPSKSPFTYVKDPAPIMEMAFDGFTGQWDWMLHVFFTGFVPQDGNSDICYAKFALADLANRDANYGKRPHDMVQRWRAGVPVGGDEMRPDGLRQSFAARHLDWVTSRRPPGVAGGFDFTDARAPIDPAFYVHLVSPGGAASVHDVYEVGWTRGRYNRAKGTYRLAGLTFAELFGPPLPDPNPDDPLTGQPIEMEVDPAAGVVRFTTPLYNATNPADPATLFNSTDFPGLIDVQLWAAYVPYVWRVCRTDANDDSPSAFADYSGPGLASPVADPADRASLGRFVIFWRRSHGASEAPHFGRTSFMYKMYTTAIQVGHPPIDTLTSVTDITNPGPNAAVMEGADLEDGIIGLAPPAPRVTISGRVIEVVYTSADGNTYTEYHGVVGWSEEKRANVDTVLSEGPLVAKREWYALNPLTDDAGVSAATYLSRYWLFWTSPRASYQYDPTPGAETGTFFRSRDVYYASVVPEFGTAVPEREWRSR